MKTILLLIDATGLLASTGCVFWRGHDRADDRAVGIKTVEKHREHLMQKLDIHDTARLTRYTISAGIIESSVRLTIA